MYLFLVQLVVSMLATVVFVRVGCVPLLKFVILIFYLKYKFISHHNHVMKKGRAQYAEEMFTLSLQMSKQVVNISSQNQRV